jgi:MoaD family protein
MVKLLRPFSNKIGKNEIEIDINGTTFIDLLKVITDEYPKLKEELYTENGKLTTYICIFVNDKPLNALSGLDTKLKNGDEILFFIPVSGG